MAAEEVKKDENAKDGAGKEKKGSNLILLIGIIAAVIILQGIMLFVFMGATKQSDPAKDLAKAMADSLKVIAAQSSSIGAITDPPIQVIVNIAGTDGGRFLKLVLVMEYDDTQYKTLFVELERRTAKLKNMLIEQLSVMSFDEIQDADAKNQIRKEFKKTVNNTLGPKDGEISNVYINEFIIQ